MTQHKFTVTAARGMLPILAKELKDLGISHSKQDQGNIRFTGTLEDAYRVCLWSRVAIRVLLPIAHFSAETDDALYQGVKNIEWEQHIDAKDSTLAVDFNSFRSKLQHSQYGAQKVKDAVVDRLREQFGDRPSVDLFQPDLRINVYIKHNQAIVSIDLSGDSLHKRGYRVQNTTAPLKEHLAAAILLSADWPSLAKKGWGLLDPMCGSGTFIIEAAMMAADIAPGLHRDYFGFLYWKQHDSEVWQRLKADAVRRRHSGLSRLPLISGGDSDQRAVTATQANLSEVGLQDVVVVKQRALLDWPPHCLELPLSGLLVCNPPYGHRIGEEGEIAQLYHSLGNIVSETLPAWRTSLITNDESLAMKTGLSVFDKIAVDNGPIACQVMHFRAPRPVSFNHQQAGQSAIPVAQMTGRAVAKTLSEHGDMFANRLRKNVKHLSKWAKKQGLQCYRVYDADLPDFAVAIDRYADYVHVQEYAPPKYIDPEKAVSRLEEVMTAIEMVMAVPRSNVILKLRQKQRGSQQYEQQAALNHRLQVVEYGRNFWVNLTDYLDTGLFLDHRLTRLLIADLAQDKDVLNLFAYTGSATVYAASGGAKSTTTIDMSNTYLSWAQENMTLNGYKGEKHQYIRANCLEWLQQAQESRQRYGLIFLDPPTFSNSSRMEGVFDIQRDHVLLITMACHLLIAGGHLIFSTNRRDFKLDEEALADFNIDNLNQKLLPEDFKRKPKIHSCWLITHQ